MSKATRTVKVLILLFLLAMPIFDNNAVRFWRSTQVNAATTESSAARFRVLRADNAVTQNGYSSERGLVSGEVSINFSSEIDKRTLKVNSVSITPEPIHTFINVVGTNLVIQGQFAPQTKYSVVLTGAIANRSGQTLSSDYNFDFNSGELSEKIDAPEVRTFTSRQNPEYRAWVQGAKALRTEIRAVTADDWLHFDSRPPGPDLAVEMLPKYGKLLTKKTISIKRSGQMVAIDLQPYFKKKYGHLLVSSYFGEHPGAIKKDRAGKISSVSHDTWIQRSDINLDAVSAEKLHILATSAFDNKPLANLPIKLKELNLSGTTDGDGRVALVIPVTKLPKLQVQAQRENDTAILKVINSRIFRDDQTAKYLCYDAVDRSPYRPGEKVTYFGTVRKRQDTSEGRGALSVQTGGKITYKVYAQNKTFSQGDCPIDTSGNFRCDIALPENCSTGKFSIMPNNIVIDGTPHNFENCPQTNFAVEEFRRSEFIAALSSDKADYRRGETVTLTNLATYLNGGTLKNCPVEWSIISKKCLYQLPDRHFWWFHRPDSEATASEPKKIFSKTDANGQARLIIGATQLDNQLDSASGMSEKLTVQCTTSDINRQQKTVKKTIWIHPSDLFVGIDSAHIFRPGEPLTCNLFVARSNGEQVENAEIDCTLRLTDIRGTSVEKIEKLKLDGGSAKLSINPDLTTRLISIRAETRDAQNRPAVIEKSLKADLKKDLSVNSWNDRLNVTLLCDKRLYKTGDTAQISVQCSTTDATGVLSVTKPRETLLLPINMRAGKAIVALPIGPDDIPGFGILAHLKDERGNHGMDETILSVPPAAKSLLIDIKPAKQTYKPGEEAQIDFSVKEANGAASQANLRVAVVDDAILGLSNYRWPEPLAQFFHAPFPIFDAHTCLLEKGLSIRVYNSRGIPPLESDIDNKSENNRVGNILMRRNFAAQAFFDANVNTDANGLATIKFKLPDSLSRYRIIVLASSGPDQFGKAEGTLQTDLLLAIKPSPPRFLYLRDRCRLSIVAQNKTANVLQTTVSLKSDGAVLASETKAVVIPPMSTSEVWFEIEASAVGQANFTCQASSGTLRDSAQFSLPVIKPQSTQIAANCGTVDGDDSSISLARPLIDPATKRARLKLDLSSTASEQLVEPLRHLRAYRFDCSEQIASRILAMVFLQKFMAPAGANAIAPQYESTISADIKSLCQRQKDDGRFGLWSQDDKADWPFISVQATRALIAANQYNKTVGELVLRNSLKHLKTIAAQIPANWDDASRTVLLAMALNTRLNGGEKAEDLVPAARALLSKPLAEMNLEAVALIYPIFAHNQSTTAEALELKKMMLGKLEETPSTASANYAASEDLQYRLLDSSIRADALVLEALLGGGPSANESESANDLSKNELETLDKLARGLLASRRNGVWRSTQENSIVLQALSKYFKQTENAAPDFEALVRLNNSQVLKNRFVGREYTVKSLEIPNIDCQNQPPITLSKRGPGRLYYRVELQYEPTPTRSAISNGFTISRTFQGVDDPAHARQDASGTWHFKSGATIRTCLKLAVPGKRHHVAMTDPFAGGSEIINSALVGSKTIAPNTADSKQLTFENVNLRDSRLEGFISELAQGEHDFSYLVQTTSPGQFTVPPARIEEMYAPETFALSAPDAVIIE